MLIRVGMRFVFGALASATHDVGLPLRNVSPAIDFESCCSCQINRTPHGTGMPKLVDRLR